MPPQDPLPPQHDKRMIIHNQLQELPPQELDTLPHPQELLLLLHPQLAADKSLIEVPPKIFCVMVYSMK